MIDPAADPIAPQAAQAADPIRDALAHPAPAPQLAQPGDAVGENGGGTYERPPFPPDCPVRPLGISSDISGSQKCYYLDVNGQLVGLEANNRHGKLGLIALFGTQSDWLESHFPQWSAPVFEGRGAAKVMVKESEIVGFDQADAARALVEECARRGIFDPSGRMRGRGAHPLPNGGLVLHHGDVLLASRNRVDGSVSGWKFHGSGLFEGYVYPSAAATPRPWHEAAGPRAAEQLLATINTWNWKRGLLDARLVLGAIGASMLGGALRWRPNVWITGGAGTGKSTLNGEDGLLDLLIGNAALRTGNASAAAIRQTLKNSTVPVFFDEIEATEDNRPAKQVIELARVASSGGTMHRGGQDHQAHEFTLKSVFWFSSINIPPIEPQDRSRLAILELKPLARDAKPLELTALRLPEKGRQLQQRMVQGWHRLEPTIAAFQAVLAAQGHTRRACDQFGTLLACADLLLNEDLPDAEALAHWAELTAPRRMAEISEAVTDHTACLNHVLSSLVQARGGEEREQLATWVGRAVAAKVAPLFDDNGHELDERADKRLQQYGLKLVNASWKAEERDLKGEVTKPGRWGAAAFEAGQPGFLAVAGSHRGLDELYRGTKWQGGVWKQSLARFPGCVEPVKVKFDHLSLTAVLVPLHHLLDGAELPGASKEAAFKDWREGQTNEGAGA